VRITGKLVDTATGGHLWADRFDGGLGANTPEHDIQTAHADIAALTE
jgi:TolB-like protein